MNKQYLNNIRALLDKMEDTQESAIDMISEACAESVANGGLLYFFGTGHSHMLCEEPFYRAGGLVCIYPILETDLMLHEGASKSSEYERLTGLGNVVVANTPIKQGDVIFLISNSGRNAACIDAAIEAKKRGAITVAVTSVTHSSNVTSRHPGGKRLFEVCDYVLDNGGCKGDASVKLDGLADRIGPTSTVVDVTMINLVMVNTAERLLSKGVVPPVFQSANTDEGDAANKAVLEKYRKLIPLL